MKEIRYIRNYYIIGILLVSIFFILTTYRGIDKEYKTIQELAILEAKTTFKREILYQEWAAKNDGIYILQNKKQNLEKNNLKESEHRELKQFNDSLYYISPEQMSRKVDKFGHRTGIFQRHIASLNAHEKQNIPDNWEKKALLSFKNGATQYSTIIKTDTARYLRFMKPLAHQTLCNACENLGNNKEMEHSCGVSIYIKLDKYYKVAHDNILLILGNHIAFYIILLLLTLYSYIRTKKILLEKEKIRQKLANDEKSLSDRNEQLKTLNSELIVAKEKAEESERLKMSFLANISHEIRTPMNGIIGFSQMLNRKQLNDDKRLYYANIIQKSGNRLLKIIDDVLDISKLETHQMTISNTEIDLHLTLKELYKKFEKENKSPNISIELQYNIPKFKSIIVMDEQKLTQILDNLLSNALKYTEKGKIEFGVELIENQLNFHVKDSGTGIKQNQIDKIFDLFNRAEDTRNKVFSGTGLGLSITQGLIKLMGGHIHVESVEGEGSTFRINLPYIPGKFNDKRKDIPLSIKPNSLKGFSILIAEDDETNYIFLDETLSIYGPRLIHAKNGVEAIEAVVKESSINLILMDLKMPVMDGIEAAKEIKRLNNNIPIIAQSAFINKNETEKNPTFDDYIEKPIKAEDLLKIIDHFS